MAEIQVNIHGVLELQNKLNRLDQDVRGRVDDALRLEVESIRIQAQSLAPKRTGYLARTVFAERVSEWSFRLEARAPYSSFVEFGTRFMQARRFLSRAFELGMVRLVQRVNAVIRETIIEAGTS